MNKKEEILNKLNEEINKVESQCMESLNESKDIIERLEKDGLLDNLSYDNCFDLMDVFRKIVNEYDKKEGLIYTKEVLNDLNSSIFDNNKIAQVIQNVLNYNKELGERYDTWIGMEYAIKILN